MFYELTDRFELNASPERVWDFFSRAENLPDITPPALGFTILTPQPIVLGPGSLIDYVVRPLGFPVRWRTRIIDWTPPRQFIDLQIRGPYTLWHHQHTFEPAPAGGVTCGYRVIYKLPAGVLGRAVHALKVKRQLREIFRFRRTVIASRLDGFRPLQVDIEIRSL